MADLQTELQYIMKVANEIKRRSDLGQLDATNTTIYAEEIVATAKYVLEREIEEIKGAPK